MNLFDGGKQESAWSGTPCPATNSLIIRYFLKLPPVINPCSRIKYVRIFRPRKQPDGEELFTISEGESPCPSEVPGRLLDV